MGTDRNVTIAMLTYNAEPFLLRILDAVKSQRTERHVELLAVDSGSTDGTLDIVRSRSVRIISIPREEFDWGLTRDLAYQEVQTSIVVNLSQDAVPAHDRWLENLVQRLDDAHVAASCGSSVPDPGRGFDQFPWERNGYFYFTREMKKFATRYGRGLSFANSAVRRSVWEQLRFDRQPIGEDFQFQTKLQAAGLSITFVDDAPVYHHHNYTIPQLSRRCRRDFAGLDADHLQGFQLLYHLLVHLLVHLGIDRAGLALAVEETQGGLQATQAAADLLELFLLAAILGQAQPGKQAVHAGTLDQDGKQAAAEDYVNGQLPVGPGFGDGQS